MGLNTANRSSGTLRASTRCHPRTKSWASRGPPPGQRSPGRKVNVQRRPSPSGSALDAAAGSGSGWGPKRKRGSHSWRTTKRSTGARARTGSSVEWGSRQGYAQGAGLRSYAGPRCSRPASRLQAAPAPAPRPASRLQAPPPRSPRPSAGQGHPPGGSGQNAQVVSPGELRPPLLAPGTGRHYSQARRREEGDAEVGTRRASLSALAGLTGCPLRSATLWPRRVRARYWSRPRRGSRCGWCRRGAGTGSQTARAFAARAFRWEDVQTVAPAALRLIPPGPALHDGALLRDAASGDVSSSPTDARRRIVDPLSFALYGLDWGRVQSLPPAVLERTPPGSPEPHAVTGQVLPDLPPAFAPPPSPPGPPRPPLPPRSATAPPHQLPLPSPDPRLTEALQLVRDYPPTAAWPAFLDRFGVALHVAPVSGGLASYRAADRTLSVDPAFARARPAGPGLSPGARDVARHLRRRPQDRRGGPGLHRRGGGGLRRPVRLLGPPLGAGGPARRQR